MNPDIKDSFPTHFERTLIPTYGQEHVINEQGINIPLSGQHVAHLDEEAIRNLKISIGIWEEKYSE